MAGELEKMLGGIDLSLNSKEDKYRELATLQSEEKYLENIEQQEMASQAAYSQYEDSVNKFSDTLLENDRQAIRGVARQGKDFLREQLQLHGGSYKKFMANGGIRTLAKYKNSIINSDEARRYKDNKLNMEKIIKARDSGKAGLLSKIDLENLNKYQTNGEGDITYSGLLTPVDKIDQNAYDLGADIPALDILKFGNNNTAILSNYMREHPERGVPSQKELIQYTQKNYGGKGKNQASLYAKQAARKAALKKEKENNQYRVFTSAQLAQNVINKNANGTVGFTAKDDFEERYSRGRKHNGSIISSKKFTNVSETSVSGIFNDVNETRPRGAYEHSGFNGSFSTAARELYKDYYNAEQGSYKFRSSDLYGANGHKLDLDETHKLKPKTVIMAQTGKGINTLSNNQNEEEYFVVEFSDKKGHLETKKNQRYLDSMGDTNLQYVPWEVWEDNDGTLYYRKMDTEGISSQKAYTTAIGKQNDINNEVAAQKTLGRADMRNRVNHEMKSKTVQNEVNSLYSNNTFKASVFDGIISNNNFAKKPEIFETLAVGLARSSGLPVSVNSINNSISSLNDIIPIGSYDLLQNKDLSFEDAYISVKKELLSEAKSEEDKEQVELLVEFWKRTYESRTNKKINFKDS